MPVARKPRPPCRNCGNAVNSPSAIFCSNKCQQEHKYAVYVNKWKVKQVSGGKAGHIVSQYVRRYLIDRDGERCSQCGWQERHTITNKVPLEVHHVNGDHTDHSENNLRLLCPNCHSLTLTYRNLNKGNGRKHRAVVRPT